MKRQSKRHATALFLGALILMLGACARQALDSEYAEYPYYGNEDAESAQYPYGNPEELGLVTDSTLTGAVSSYYNQSTTTAGTRGITYLGPYGKGYVYCGNYHRTFCVIPGKKQWWCTLYGNAWYFTSVYYATGC